MLQTDTNKMEQDHAATLNLARSKIRILVYRGWVLLPSKKARKIRDAIVAVERPYGCNAVAGTNWPLIILFRMGRAIPFPCWI